MIIEGSSAEWFEEFCDITSTKYIFGAGQQAINTLYLLHLLGKKVNGVVASKVDSEELLGVPMRSLDEIVDCENSSVLLAVGRKLSLELMETINSRGYEKVYVCKDWDTTNDDVKERVFCKYMEKQGVDTSGEIISLGNYRFLNPLNYPRTYRQMLMGTYFSEIIVPGIMKDNLYSNTRIYEELEKLIGNDWICIDVGANAGLFSAYLASRVSRVYAFDASKAIQPYLKKNTEFAGNVRIETAIVGNADGEDFFYDIVSYPKYSSLHMSENATEYKLKKISLDSWADEEGVIPHLIRFDIGNYVFSALEGSKKIIELHHPLLLFSDSAGIRDELGKYARENGYKTEYVDSLSVLKKET